MQLKDIMTTNVVTITGEGTIASAAQRMAQANVGCLLVTNAGALKGIITDRDIAVRCVGAGEDPRLCQVSDHMTTPVVTATPTMDVLGAAHLTQSARSSACRWRTMGGWWDWCLSPTLPRPWTSRSTNCW